MTDVRAILAILTKMKVLNRQDEWELSPAIIFQIAKYKE